MNEPVPSSDHAQRPISKHGGLVKQPAALSLASSLFTTAWTWPSVLDKRRCGLFPLTPSWSWSPPDGRNLLGIPARGPCFASRLRRCRRYACILSPSRLEQRPLVHPACSPVPAWCIHEPEGQPQTHAHLRSLLHCVCPPPICSYHRRDPTAMKSHVSESCHDNGNGDVPKSGLPSTFP